MALDLGPKLEEALNDTANAVWGATEIDDLLSYALAQVNRVRPRRVTDEIPFVAEDDTYVLTNVYEVFRVDILDPDDRMLMKLSGNAWEIWGDNQTAGQTLYVNPRYARDGYSMRVHGYGPYDYTTNTPGIQLQTAILAIARAEAYRRVTGERARFEQYATANPRSDTSMAELLQLTNEADAEAQRLLSDIRLIKQPTAGRV